MNASLPPAAPEPSPWLARSRRFSAAALRAFHRYAGWLVSISWRRFFVYAMLLIVAMAIVHDKPPLTWTLTERFEHRAPKVVVLPAPPARPARPALPAPAAKASTPSSAASAPMRIETKPRKDGSAGIEITIGDDGVRIRSREAAEPSPNSAAASASSTAASAAGSGAMALPRANERGGLVISDDVRQALEEARVEIEQALREAHQDASEALRDAEQARDDARQVLEEISGKPRSSVRTTRVGIGDFLMQLTLLFVMASAVVKGTYKGRMQAEVKAAQAVETAEAESLKRQVVEARMAAMQAQVEPHFLFNTLASIDHLIETDPKRASQMQKNLIALLRASMPNLRDTADGGPRELGREVAMIRPYLEILKVRMEERLDIEMQVPDGLLSAEFPPMMMQTLVENAIKHGLEPKPEGGKLRVAAEIVHGKLQVTVADTGLGFGKAATAGTGVGLANIRERLQLLYGGKASLTVTENQPSGTVITVTLPYKTVAGAFG